MHSIYKAVGSLLRCRQRHNLRLAAQQLELVRQRSAGLASVDSAAACLDSISVVPSRTDSFESLQLFYFLL
jgi:hypothetical protein